MVDIIVRLIFLKLLVHLAHTSAQNPTVFMAASQQTCSHLRPNPDGRIVTTDTFSAVLTRRGPCRQRAILWPSLGERQLAQ